VTEKKRFPRKKKLAGTSRVRPRAARVSVYVGGEGLRANPHEAS
jgi:hypothetical protein